jgi:hypothetical protein
MGLDEVVVRREFELVSPAAGDTTRRHARGTGCKNCDSHRRVGTARF